MSTTFRLLDRVYKHLNCATVTTTIDGRIYRRKRPLNSAKRDIVITPLALPDSDGMDVQPGTVFINSFIKNDEDGQIPEATLKATTDAVISRIAAWPWCPSTYLHLEIAGEATYDDPENPGWSYSSVRVNAITE